MDSNGEPPDGLQTAGGGKQRRKKSSKFLVVGLGNPGRKYRRNRHNFGFMMLDAFADRLHIPFDRVQSRAMLGKGRLGEAVVYLAKPQTYVNLSGECVGPLANYYRIEASHTLVIYDELDLPLGTIRLREKGGAGGHNGMKSVIQHLGQAFPRMRLGIGRPPPRMPAAAFVLRNFDKVELAVVDEVVDQGLLAAECFIREGIEAAMSRYNTNVLSEDQSG